MKYFATLPTIAVTDPNNNLIIAVNLLARSSIVENLINEPSLFYLYDIQEGDTPEIIASKYYDDPYRYWIVLFANHIFDPQWEWPLTYKQFQVYINNKYSAAANTAGQTPLQYTQSNIQEYRKTITISDTESQTTTANNYTIDAATYTALIPTQQTVKFQSGATSTYSVSKQPLTIYDWEDEQNEKKRSIRLFNASYVGQLEQQLESIMNR